MRAWLLASIALVPAMALAGCVGEDTAGEPLDADARDAPQVSSTLGAVRGVLTDTAVQPIEGATVAVLELERETVTRADGSYSIDTIAPGTYTLTVSGHGFVPATEQVRVRAGEIATVDFLVLRLVSEDAYVQTLELGGFMECGVGGGANLTVLPELPEPLNGLRDGTAVSWTICEDVDHTLGNTTRDESFWIWEMDAPMHTFIYEVEWDHGGNTLASKFWSRVSVATFAREITAGPYTVMDLNGVSPLLGRVDRAALESLQANFTELCEGGEDAYCGHSFFDEGWELSSSVLPWWSCLHETASVCADLQQEFRVFITGFYNAPAPPGWAISAAGA